MSAIRPSQSMQQHQNVRDMIAKQVHVLMVQENVLSVLTVKANIQQPTNIVTPIT